MPALGHQEGGKYGDDREVGHAGKKERPPGGAQDETEVDGVTYAAIGTLDPKDRAGRRVWIADKVGAEYRPGLLDEYDGHQDSQTAHYA
jgi:hypothetical protein